MIDLKQFEIWFVTGSQHLYGDETLKKVDADSKAIVAGLSQSGMIHVNIIFKPVLTGAKSIHDLCIAANSDNKCVGIIAWMHTFSPAKMWISGLKALKKPFLHLHTQFNREIPWSDIDMDFMNLNQSAHGDREFGFIGSRMRLSRKVVVGFWQDEDVINAIDSWSRVACAWHDAQGARIARFGDNMRDVAVTEGDKVEAEIRLGYSVNGYGVGDLADFVKNVPEPDILSLISDYQAQYTFKEPIKKGGSLYESLFESARIEAGLRAFLRQNEIKAFTTTFEDLHGLSQLPGLGVQRLMAEGYGFGAEGDWKTAALVRAMKVMGAGLPGGTSFMEDYTYHFVKPYPCVLGAHMLEVCESIADNKPSLEIHPLSIGGKENPARLVFTAKSGPAVCASIIDMGNRFRMIVNVVDVIPPVEPLPKLPVASAVWIPRPDLKTAAGAWIYAGGAHHSSFSQSVSAQQLEDFADMAGIEFLLIDDNTEIRDFIKEIRWNETYYHMKEF
ncbi:MAG: L-arabinose isomerase [Brevinematales bacterium]|jgi:L-arabinose isomerase